MSIINIAIDGPAGAGKSTIAKLLAKKMNLTYVDTGSMFRALALKALRYDLNVADEESVKTILDSTRMSFKKVEGEQHICIDGEDVEAFIRNEKIADAASVISVHPSVRKKLLDIQQQIARNTDIVMDGRDIGTVVLPNTPYKFYVTADRKIRAMRRYKEYEQKGILAGRTFEQLLNELELRDERDMNRETAPLRPAERATIIDTSELTVDEVVNLILEDID